MAFSRIFSRKILRKERFSLEENRKFGLDKYTRPAICGLPTADELRAALKAGESAEVREQLAMLFDEATFIEISAYAKRGFSDFIATEKSNEFEGVVCGYGAIDGKLVFAFAEDGSRMGGVIDERHAKKIADLYSLAMKNGAPVIGIFNSNGTDIFAGTAGLAAYGRIMACVSEASGAIPQIAFVSGKCIGLSAAIAAMFDIIVKADGAKLYVGSPDLTGVNNAQDMIVSYTASAEQCAGYIRNVVSFLPSNSDMGISSDNASDNINRMLGELDFAGDARSLISVISDNGVFTEISADFAPAAVTAFATVAGVRCGIVANAYSVNDGRIDAPTARKISRFVDLCDAFNLPIVTVVDSLGLALDKDNENNYFAAELGRLAHAYVTATVPKITVINGHAIGASFVLLGSKSLGADLVYATYSSEICALSADSGVAFAWDKYITLEKSREELVQEWKNSVSSPARAAESGEIDDIISVNEMRARICSALLMLSEKGNNPLLGCKILPL